MEHRVPRKVGFRYNDALFRMINYEDRAHIGCVDTSKEYKLSPECPDVRYLFEVIDEEEFPLRGLWRKTPLWNRKKKK